MDEETLYRLWDLARHGPWQTALLVAIIASVIADLVVHALKILIKKEWTLALIIFLVTFCSVLFLLHITPPDPPPPLPDLSSLLGKSRGAPEISAALREWGRPEESTLSAGRELCFRKQGIDFRFNSKDVLDTIAFFSGFPGDIHNMCDSRLLPLGLRPMESRADVRNQIDRTLNRHLDPKICGAADCDQYELESYRLFLLYKELDGQQELGEVDMVKPEVFEQAALGR
jgi:hypothetical protein